MQLSEERVFQAGRIATIKDLMQNIPCFFVQGTGRRLVRLEKEGGKERVINDDVRPHFHPVA